MICRIRVGLYLCPICRRHYSNLDPVDDLMFKAYLCNRERSFVEARRLLDEVLRIDPDQADAACNSAELYWHGQGVEQNLTKVHKEHKAVIGRIHKEHKTAVPKMALTWAFSSGHDSVAGLGPLLVE